MVEFQGATSKPYFLDIDGRVDVKPFNGRGMTLRLPSNDDTSSTKDDDCLEIVLKRVELPFLPISPTT